MLFAYQKILGKGCTIPPMQGCYIEERSMHRELNKQSPVNTPGDAIFYLLNKLYCLGLPCDFIFFIQKSNLYQILSSSLYLRRAVFVGQLERYFSVFQWLFNFKTVSYSSLIKFSGFLFCNIKITNFQVSDWRHGIYFGRIFKPWN